ncbi:helix-turn-helix domain-containing protein [Rhizobium sp. LjRoot30]|uniref:winged helix-turn-helix domain-containing protein n=1 Tax=Rhizobium sp. LjRoot30 TaxID=3342320 RepID=UPI003ECC22E2
MNVHAPNLDIEKFRKVAALMTAGATDGERAAAKARAESMAAKAGMTLKAALSKLSTPQPAKPASFFDGFDDWMEEREPGYKAKMAAEKAEKAVKDAARRKEVLARFGSEQALFARTERECLLAAAMKDIAKWRDWTDDDGTTYTYADEIDGKRDFWRISDVTDKIMAAVVSAYPVPATLAGVLSEYHDWEHLRSDRQVFCDGEWNHHLYVDARLAVIMDVLDSRPASSWDDMRARMGWWDECLSWDIRASPEDQRKRKERIAADIEILRAVSENLTDRSHGSDLSHAHRRTNADKAAMVREILTAEPNLSDREISRRAGVSPQTVSNWRARMR